MKRRNVLSYGLLVFGVLALFGAALLGLSIPPLAPVALAVSLMGIGGGWLAMARESEVGSGRPMSLFVGRLILTAGVLFAVLCGACTLAFWGVFIPPTLSPGPHAPAEFTPRTVAGAIMLPLVVGGIPFLIGLAIGALGRWLVRSYHRTAGRQ